MTFTLRVAGGGVRQKWDVVGRRGVGVSEYSGRPIFFFFIKGNWACAVTRHHIEPNINILLTINLPFDSEVRQWSHPLMISLDCLRDKSSNRTRGQFEYDVMFLFWFCSFTCTVKRSQKETQTKEWKARQD